MFVCGFLFNFLFAQQLWAMITTYDDDVSMALVKAPPPRRAPNPCSWDLYAQRTFFFFFEGGGLHATIDTVYGGK